MEYISKNKNILRKKAILERNSMSIFKYNNKVLNKIGRNKYFIENKHILAYYPIKNEFNFIWELIWLHQEKIYYFPTIDPQTKTISFYQGRHKNDFKQGYYNIPEPQNKKNKWNNQKNSLIIVPSLLLDIYGNRIGYGGGYYDKFIQKHPNITSISVNFKLNPPWTTLPVEKHDQKIQHLIFLSK